VASDAILEMTDIHKVFPGTVALDGVDFDLRRGEVHAIIGENGAGKSTLMRILCGIKTLDTGSIRVNGAERTIQGPKDALALGVHMIHQEFANFPHLSVAENISVGRLPRRRLPWVVDRRRLQARAKEMLDRMRLPVDPAARLDSLSVAQQQLIEVAKALSGDLRILIMDEATSSLNVRETEQLFSTIQALKDQGIGIVYISHRLKEVLSIADRISVLRDGRNAGTFERGGFDENAIIRAMLGRQISLAEKKPRAQGEVVYRVEGLSIPGRVKDFSFELHRGEILGISGLSGSGKEVIVRSLYGLWPSRARSVEMGGKRIDIRRPAEALRHGIAYLAEERKTLSLFPGMSIRENASLVWLLAIWKRFLISLRREVEAVERYTTRLNVKMTGIRSLVNSLSGGNQQKLILARLLMVDPSIVMLNDPTRGVDVGSKQEIYEAIYALARQGASILMTSSEIPEVANLADRVLVLSRGVIIGELAGSDVTADNILALASRSSSVRE
jgi:ABC-type sugar transport system ATPase subunit